MKVFLNVNQIDSDNVNIEHGFAHITLDTGKIVQCCLIQRKNGKGFKKQIDAGDCGYNDGICGDVNEPAFKRYGIGLCLDTLFYHMRKKGVKILNRI